MKKGKKKYLSVYQDEVWCFDCMGKEPFQMNLAAFLIPVRELPYDENKALIGICDPCLDKRSLFHQKDKRPVDRHHPLLLYKNI